MELDLQTINYYNREDKIIENYEDEKKLELLELLEGESNLDPRVSRIMTRKHKVWHLWDPS